jgi:hypothetical protein
MSAVATHSQPSLAALPRAPSFKMQTSISEPPQSSSAAVHSRVGSLPMRELGLPPLDSNPTAFGSMTAPLKHLSVLPAHSAAQHESTVATAAVPVMAFAIGNATPIRADGAAAASGP